MERAIEIKTVPIVIEMNIKNANIKMNRDSDYYELHRTKGSVDYNITNSKIKIDTYDAKKSVASKNNKKAVGKYVSNGRYKTQTSASNYEREGEQRLNYYVNSNVLAQVSQQQNLESASNKHNLSSTASEKLNSEYASDDFSNNFFGSDIDFKWNRGELNFEYEPCSFDLVVKQYNKVMIDYILGPNYVPPSADPSYEPVDMYA